MNPPTLTRYHFNAGTDKKPEWRDVSYMISGENICNKFPDESARERAMNKARAMLNKKVAA